MVIGLSPKLTEDDCCLESLLLCDAEWREEAFCHCITALMVFISTPVTHSVSCLLVA